MNDEPLLHVTTDTSVGGSTSGADASNAPATMERTAPNENHSLHHHHGIPPERQQEQQRQHVAAETNEKQEQSFPLNDDNLNNMTDESIYEFYKNHIFPAIMSSFPILLQRIWTDIVSYVALASHRLYLFILPTWWKEGDYGGNENGTIDGPTSWLLSTQKQLWEQAVESSKTVNATVAEFMLHHFDTNQDGHISASEFLNMTDLFEKLQNDIAIAASKTPTPESFWMWFSREWPLMDWKIGVFLWQTFGGLLLVIAVLSIVPGRLHTWSGKILRWPILGLTNLLVAVELVVYIVIRLGIRAAETVFATPKHRALRRKMAAATSYEEWYQYAAALDLSQKRDKWQRTITDSTSYQYNWPLIQQLMMDMREARQKQDVILAMAVLQQCTRKNVGGIMSEDLFSKTYTGEPKFIVIEFIDEVTKTLHWVTEQVMSAEEAAASEAVLRESTHHTDDDDINNGNELEPPSESIDKYEKSLEHKSRHEREHLWQSLIGLAINVATLNFHHHDHDDDRDKKKEQAEEKKAAKETTSNNEQSQTKPKGGGKPIATAPTTAASLASPTRNTASVDQMDRLNIAYSLSEDVTDIPENHGNEVDSNKVPSIKSVASIKTMAHREQLLAFLKRARAAYGRTALCLSGGAMMGLYHFGHLQGLIETDCLPNIISGCSAGSVIGAILCTRTNDELQRDLDPQVIGPHMKCFDRPWSQRLVSFWRTGNLFSADDWHKMIKWFTCGDMTFEEAYKKTGRIFCIALAATTKKTPPVLINYISAPNVTIASAVVASAAVPGFVYPQQLQIKDPDGTVRSAGPETYFDGSIRHDIPTAGLSEMLNCQFFVACQCNPHIVPFFFDPRGGVGRPSRWSSGCKGTSWRGGFLLAALEMYLKNDMKAKQVFLRDLDAAVSFTGTMLTQSFEGSTTIVPRVRLRDFFTLFSDPSIESLEHYTQVGSVAAYQHAAMIRLHYKTADALDECIDILSGPKEDEHPSDSFKVKVNRRASFDVNKKIAKALVDIQAPRESQHMPEVIATALHDRLESDSTSLSDASTG